MPMKKRLTAGLAAALMAAVILDGQSALESASEGIDLCLRTVIPALFPFLFLCALITASLWGEPLPRLRILSRRLGIPTGGESLLICGFLGGYPTGAQILGTCYQEGRLDRSTAQRLLPLCSNAGPAFLFGMAARQFSAPGTAAALWIVQILSTFFTAALCKAATNETVSFSKDHTTVFGQLHRSVRTIALICGWILLFQILSGFLERWFYWLLPPEIQILLKGLLELSSGCCDLHRIGSEALRFLICTVQLSFGGLCVTMQTASVIGSLSLWGYLRGKLLQTGAAAILSIAYLQWGWAALAAAGAVIFLSPLRVKNNCSFSTSTGV